MSAFEQTEPEPISTPPNDEVLGGNFLDISHVRDPRHREYLRKANTFFDEIRERFNKTLEFVEYDRATGQRTVLYNPFEPQNEGMSLIDTNSFMYSLCQISMIVCYDIKFNDNINLLTDEKNKTTWSAVTTAGETKIAIKLADSFDMINGVAITFDNSEKHDYQFTVSFINDSNQIISQIFNATPSSRTNTKQFFILNSPVENIGRITVELKELTTDGTSTYNLKNISILSFVNRQLLKGMADNNIIEYQEIDNPIFLKELAKDDVSILENNTV
jgi:hypothetical protein